MAYGLDVDCFLNALNRMINRREVPEENYLIMEQILLLQIKNNCVS